MKVSDEMCPSVRVSAVAKPGPDLQELFEGLPSSLQALVRQVSAGIQQGLDSIPLITGKTPNLSALQRQLLAGLERFQELLGQLIRAGDEELIEEALYIAMVTNHVPLADRTKDGVINRHDLDISVDSQERLRLQFALAGQFSGDVVDFERQSDTPLGGLSISGGLQGAIAYQVNLDLALAHTGQFSLNESVPDDIVLTAFLTPARGSQLTATAGPLEMQLRDQGSYAGASLTIDLRGLDQVPSIEGAVDTNLAVEFRASAARPEWSFAGRTISLLPPSFSGDLQLRWNPERLGWDGEISVPNGPAIDLNTFSGSGIDWQQLLPLLSGDPSGTIGGAVERYLEAFTSDLLRQLEAIPLFDLLGTNVPGFSDAGAILDYVLKAFSDVGSIRENPQTELILESLVSDLLNRFGYAGLYTGLNVSLLDGGIELAITLQPSGQPLCHSSKTSVLTFSV